VEQLCLEESVELKTLLTEITIFENPLNSSLHSVTLRLLGDKIHSLVRSNTGKVWLQFIYLISFIKDFIQTERMQLSMDPHFVACRKLLNPIAASGHLHYAKYAQMMRCLPSEHPWLYQMQMDDRRHVVKEN